MWPRQGKRLRRPCCAPAARASAAGGPAGALRPRAGARTGRGGGWARSEAVRAGAAARADDGPTGAPGAAAGERRRGGGGWLSPGRGRASSRSRNALILRRAVGAIVGTSPTIAPRYWINHDIAYSQTAAVVGRTIDTRSRSAAAAIRTPTRSDRRTVCSRGGIRCPHAGPAAGAPGATGAGKGRRAERQLASTWRQVDAQRRPGARRGCFTAADAAVQHEGVSTRACCGAPQERGCPGRSVMSTARRLGRPPECGGDAPPGQIEQVDEAPEGTERNQEAERR